MWSINLVIKNLPVPVYFNISVIILPYVSRYKFWQLYVQCSIFIINSSLLYICSDKSCCSANRYLSLIISSSWSIFTVLHLCTVPDIMYPLFYLYYYYYYNYYFINYNKNNKWTLLMDAKKGLSLYSFCNQSLNVYLPIQ